MKRLRIDSLDAAPGPLVRLDGAAHVGQPAAEPPTHRLPEESLHPSGHWPLEHRDETGTLAQADAVAVFGVGGDAVGVAVVLLFVVEGELAGCDGNEEGQAQCGL